MKTEACSQICDGYHKGLPFRAEHDILDDNLISYFKIYKAKPYPNIVHVNTDAIKLNITRNKVDHFRLSGGSYITKFLRDDSYRWISWVIDVQIHIKYHKWNAKKMR